MAAGVSTNLIKPETITFATIAEMKNAMVMLDKVDRQVTKDFKKVGDTIDLRKPVLHKVVDGSTTITPTVPEESYAQQVLDKHSTVTFSLTASDLTLSVEDFTNRFIKQAAIALVQDIESNIAAEYPYIYNAVDNTTAISAFTDVANVSKSLTYSSTPKDRMRSAFYDPTASQVIASLFTGVQPSAIATKAIEEAHIGRIASMNLFESVSVKAHTVGGLDGGGLAESTVSQASNFVDVKNTWTQSFKTDDWTASQTGVVTQGDVFTMGVNSVNPITLEDTGQLQQFTVTSSGAANDSDGSGVATITISPPIIVSGPYQTVVAEPANNAALTFIGTADTAYTQNLAFHRDAISVGFAPFELPPSVIHSTTTMDGLTVTMSEDWDQLNYKNIYRLDVLYGVKLQLPQFACRHYNAI